MCGVEIVVFTRSMQLGYLINIRPRRVDAKCSNRNHIEGASRQIGDSLFGISIFDSMVGSEEFRVRLFKNQHPDFIRIIGFRERRRRVRAWKVIVDDNQLPQAVVVQPDGVESLLVRIDVAFEKTC